MKIRFEKDPAKIRIIKACPEHRKWNPTKTYKRTGETVFGYWEVEPTMDNLRYLIQNNNIMGFDINTVKMFQEKLDFHEIPLETLPSGIDVDWNCKPYAHQKVGFDLCYRNPRLGLFWEQGVGKTLPTMKIIEHRLKNNQCKNVLVCSPKTVRYSWISQLTQFSPDIKIHNLQGLAKKRKIVLDNNEGLFLINYDLLRWMKKDLADKKFDMVVYDESHYVKTHNSLRTKAAYYISCDSKYVVLLTGTPIGNGAEDLFAQFKIIDESIFGTDFNSFKYRYFHCIENDIWILSQENAKKIKKKMMMRSQRLAKKDVLDLPPKIYQNYDVEMSPIQKKIYDGMKNHLFAYIDGIKVMTRTAMAQMMKLNQIANGFYMDTENNRIIDINDDKVNELEEIVNANPDMKITVWTIFRYDIVKIKRRFPDAVVIAGGVSDTDRKIAIERLQTDPTCKMIICNFTAAAEGNTFTASELVVFYSRDFKTLLKLQSYDRNHRIGLKNKVLYIELAVRKTIEDRIKWKFEKRRDFANDMLDYNEESMSVEIYNEIANETVANSNDHFDIDSIISKDKKIKIIEGASDG